MSFITILAAIDILIDIFIFNKISGSNYSYFPFSLGPRSCIGRQFAEFESKIITAKFFQHFKYRLDDSCAFGMSHNLTIRPKNGIRIFLSFK